MARKHNKSSGGGGSVTHRSRGRFTIVSPQNMVSPAARASVQQRRAEAKSSLLETDLSNCGTCGSHRIFKKTKPGRNRCRKCHWREVRQREQEALEKR